MPNPHYMESQRELAWKMRGILMDWLIQVHVWETGCKVEIVYFVPARVCFNKSIVEFGR